MANLIPITEINLGGLADSKWAGLKNSVARLIGFDIHSTPGLLKVNQKLVKETTGTPPDEFVKVQVASSDGNSYHFSSTSGKVWKRTSAGSYSLAYTTAPTRGAAACLGAKEYGGYIYWATENYLHRIPVTGLSDWATNAQANWQELDLYQSIGSTGQTETLPTSISEAATDKQTFIPTESPITIIAVNVSNKGTGNWTLTLHDANNTSVGSVTINNGSLTNGAFNLFIFSTPIEIKKGNTYHFHITSTVADGVVVTGVANDLEEVQTKIYTDNDSEFHPMEEVNLVLFIGDRHLIHQVEDETFTHNALDLNPPLRVKCLRGVDTELLIGTFVNDNVNKTQLYVWNTWSVSYSSSDPIDEVGINAIIPSDNYVLVNAGRKGNIYLLNGQRLELYRNIPGDFSKTKQAWVHPNAAASLNGLPLFGISNKTGDPCDQGVYSIGSRNMNYLKVMALEYPISERSSGDYVLSGIEIGSILIMDFDVLVSWKNGATVGIDTLDYNTKLEKGILETRVINLDKFLMNKFLKFLVDYEQLPASTSIKVHHKVNHTANYTEFTAGTEAINDTDRKQIVVDQEIEARTLQVKVEALSNVNDAPTIEDVLILAE